MIDSGISILKQKIDSLPVYSPEESLWDSIEARLDFEKKLSDEISKLPDYLPSDDLWIQIEKSIQQPVIRRFHPKLWYYAASVALLIASSLIINMKLRNIHRGDRINISTELSYQTITAESPSNRWPEPTQYINNLCKLNTKVCNTPEFQEKKRLLQELDVDEKTLQDFEAKFGTSQSLEKSKIRIEKTRSEIIRELLKMIEG